MKVLESEAKNLLSGQGISVPKGRVVTSVQEAVETAEMIGFPVAIKAQIPMGRRLKAGGVWFARTRAETTEAVNRMLGLSIHGFSVWHILVEEKLDIATE